MLCDPPKKIYQPPQPEIFIDPLIAKNPVPIYALNSQGANVIACESISQCAASRLELVCKKSVYLSSEIKKKSMNENTDF